MFEEIGEQPKPNLTQQKIFEQHYENGLWLFKSIFAKAQGEFSPSSRIPRFEHPLKSLIELVEEIDDLLQDSRSGKQNEHCQTVVSTIYKHYRDCEDACLSESVLAALSEKPGIPLMWKHHVLAQIKKLPDYLSPEYVELRIEKKNLQLWESIAEKTAALCKAISQLETRESERRKYNDRAKQYQPLLVEKSILYEVIKLAVAMAEMPGDAAEEMEKSVDSRRRSRAGPLMIKGLDAAALTDYAATAGDLQARIQKLNARISERQRP